ncbi:MAG TPA: RDD family protein [Candidatus Baltobacteraceae bacterium]|nr:RDD family protein [Candidatus Baltobacteraceae bacterium]
MSQLFRGPLSLTYRGERVAFFLTLLFALPAAGAIGFFIHEEVGMSQVALFLVVAMVYVTLGRGRLVGTSVRVHETQYPQLFAIVKRCAAALDLPMPLVFVREDYNVPVLAVGLGDPYSLVISSNWIEHFKEDELTFMIGRELGHIASGHTRFTSLLSVNGNENPIVSLVFGAWLRKAELTCDRVGLLCCGSLDAATRAIAVASFHHFARKIDHEAFARQHEEMGTDSVFRLGEWLGAMPYATTRVDRMREFIGSNLYRIHEEHFIAESAAEPVHLVARGESSVEPKDCAGWWRRAWAFFLDGVVVFAITSILSHASQSGGAKGEAFSLNMIPFSPIAVSSISSAGVFAFLVYCALLVTLVGQTPGMLIAGLRVVRSDFGRVGFGQAIWRYVLLLVLFWYIAPLSPFSRVYANDKWSGTRLIKTERVLARTATA